MHPPLKPGWVDAPHHVFKAGRLALESGEAIEDCAVSYVTHGTLAPDKSNVIVALSAIGSTHHRLDFLIGPGRALDPARWFIVAIDALGNGLSSSPSTSRVQSGAAFPRFSIRDMIASQYRLLTEGLGLARVHAVIGASMGGMQALQWAVSHKRFMRDVIALTPMARTAPWARAVNATARAALDADPTARAWSLVMRALASRSPQALAAEFGEDRDALDRWLQGLVLDTRVGGFEAADWIAQSHAYDAHDVGQTAGFTDTEAALRSIEASVLVMAPPLDLYNPAQSARWAAGCIPGARFVEIPSIEGHQAANTASSADVALLDAEIAAFLARGSR